MHQMTQFIGLLEQDGTIVEINQAALQFRALRRAQVIGELLWEMPWWERLPEGRARVRDSVAARRPVERSATRLNCARRRNHPNL